MGLHTLPDEVILQIFELLDDGKTRPSTHKDYAKRTSSPFLPLSLVCYRLNTLAEPFLYSRLRWYVPTKDYRSGNSPSTSWITFDKILPSLSRRSHRYNFIRTLDLDLSHVLRFNEQHRQDLLRSLGQFPREASVNLYCNSRLFLDMELLKTLATMKLHNLETDSAVVEGLIEPGYFRELRSISLNGTDSHKKQIQQRYWWNHYKLPVDLCRKSSVEYFKATFETYHPCTALPVLHWITSLRSLDFTFSSTQLWKERSNYSDLQRMLDIHSSTLERIRLGTYSGTLVNFGRFSNLQELEVGRAQFFAAGCASMASQLAAPRLHKLSIDFKISAPNLENYGEYHSSHLEEFVKEYRSIIKTGGIQQIYLFGFDFGKDQGDDFWQAIDTISDDVRISTQFREYTDPIQMKSST